MSAADTLEQIERRRRTRMQVHWPLVFFQPGTPDTVESTTRDLSSEGFYCLAKTRFTPGEIRECTIRVPTHHPDTGDRVLPAQCKVRVVRVEAVGETGLYGVGFRIEDYRLIHAENGRCAA